MKVDVGGQVEEISGGVRAEEGFDGEKSVRVVVVVGGGRRR